MIIGFKENVMAKAYRQDSSGRWVSDDEVACNSSGQFVDVELDTLFNKMSWISSDTTAIPSQTSYPPNILAMPPQQSKTNTRERYGLNDNPDFKEGEVVEVDMGYYNSNRGIIEGVVVGKYNFNYRINSWIIDFGEYVFGNEYPYKVANIPIQAIVKQEKLNWE